METVFSFSSADFRLVLIGAASAIIAAVLGKIFLVFFRSNPKVVWSHEWIHGTLMSNGKPDVGLVTHRIILENVGSGIAKEVLLVFPNLNAELKVSRHDRFNIMRTSNKITDDLGCRHDSNEKSDRLLVPNLEGRTIACVTYVTSGNSSYLYPNSVTFDGQSATEQSLGIPFLRARDIFLYFIRNHGWFTILMSLWLVGLVIGQVLEMKK